MVTGYITHVKGQHWTRPSMKWIVCATPGQPKGYGDVAQKMMNSKRQTAVSAIGCLAVKMMTYGLIRGWNDEDETDLCQCPEIPPP